MTAELFLGQAALAVIFLLVAYFRPSIRTWALVGAAALGVGVGLVLLFLARSDDAWRTTAFSGAVAVAAVGVVCAWLLTGVTSAERFPWQRGVLVGVAGAGLALAAGNQWVVPALLFWMCSSFALAALGALRPEPVAVQEEDGVSFALESDRSGRVAVWIALFASDAALAAGLIGHALDTESWRVPVSLEGWPLVAVLGAAVIRSGVIPRTGVWGTLGSPGLPVLPLVTAGSFVLVVWALGSPIEWMGVGLLVVAIAVAVWGLARPRLTAASIGAVPVALALGAAVSAPSATVAAGTTAVIAVSLVAVWPLLRGGEGARALHVALVPPTVGFVAVTIAAVATFDRAIASDRVADSVVNVLFSGLLLVALPVTVALGARVARAGPAQSADAAPARQPVPITAAAWVLLAASIAMAIVPPGVLGIEGQPLGAPRARLLFAAAALAGLLVTWLFRKTGEGEAVEDVGEVSFATLVPRTTKRSGKVLGYVAVLLALGAVGAVGWFTVYGMSLGFL